MVRPALSFPTSVVPSYVSFRTRGAILSSPLALLVVLGCATSAGAQPARGHAVDVDADALCPWGRVANGRGGLVRCLSEGEARRLMTVSPPPAAALLPAAAPAVAAPSSRPSAETRPGIGRAPTPPASNPTPPAAAAPGEASGRSAAPAPQPGAVTPPGVAPAQGAPAQGAPAQAAPAVEPPGDTALTVDIGEPSADVGTLPDAVRSLAKANDRLRECVQKNGGVTGERGEVELRFLVRGRGRAEGVSVKKWKGLTEAAARCVADVVDRRYVGYPEEPIVGVTMTLSFGKKKQ